MHHPLRRVRLIALVAVALTAAACGDDGGEPAETGSAPEEATTTSAPEETTTTSEGDAPGVTVDVTAVDYAFEDLPEELATGTTLSLTNASDAEAHELVAFRLPDDETRPVSELVQLPEEELETIFGAGPPALVIVAGPGETDTIMPVGDGTLSETGRYAIVCFLPVGGDPAAAVDPDAEGPPEGDGPPHVTQGMFAEVTVA